MLLNGLQIWFLPGFLVILFLIGLFLLYSELRNAARVRKMKQNWLSRFPDPPDRRKAG